MQNFTAILNHLSKLQAMLKLGPEPVARYRRQRGELIALGKADT